MRNSRIGSRHASVLHLALAILSSLVTLPLCAQSAERQIPVLLISIDGLRPDYVLQADRHRLRIPALRRLMQQGSYASGVRGVVPTVTYPSHTTLLTGTQPATHGVYANTTFDPLLKNATGWYWYAEDIRVPTLWDAVGAAGLVTANVHWPVSAGAHVRYNLPQYWRTGTADDRKLLRLLATPGLLDTLERELGPYADGIDESIGGDETRGRFAVRLLERTHPAFMTVYLTALDHEQHASGPFSRASIATLERIDTIVGRLVDAAEQSGVGRAVVCVVSDHGFARTDHDVNLLVPFRSAALLRFISDSSTAPTAWDATVWPAGGSVAIMLRDRSDTLARNVAHGLLEALARDTSSGVARIVDARTLHERGGFPDADWLVDLKPGYKFGSATRGPLVTAANVGGTHGYWPDLTEMNASFFIAGAGIASGHNLGVIDMRDVAPTLAALLRVHLPSAEGRDLLSADVQAGNR